MISTRLTANLMRIGRPAGRPYRGATYVELHERENSLHVRRKTHYVSKPKTPLTHVGARGAPTRFHPTFSNGHNNPLPSLWPITRPNRSGLLARRAFNRPLPGGFQRLPCDGGFQPVTPALWRLPPPTRPGPRVDLSNYKVQSAKCKKFSLGNLHSVLPSQVGGRGLEPLTSTMSTWRSSQLS